jgi:knotted carbamoyltransferase YgeW
MTSFPTGTSDADRALDAAVIEGLRGRSALLTTDLTRAELDAVVEVAATFEALDRQGAAPALFRSELAYALFFDQSTRTRSAWAGAAARLGMQPVIVDGHSTQVAHGETAEETGAMLGMNAHALGVRHDLILGAGQPFQRDIHRGITRYLKETGQPRSVPVVNLQCDVDHPTQTLADVAWLRERFGRDLSGLKVAVTWAYSPSYAKPLSVPQGLITLLPRLGADVRLAHPEGYALTDDALARAGQGAEEGGGKLTQVRDMDAAFADADVIYPKSWGPLALMTERVDANAAGDTAALADIEARALAKNAEHRGWICDERVMATTAKGEALYMHCLPADIGAEVSPGVMARARLNVARQAQKKVYVIMALLAAAKHPSLVAALEQAGGRRA